MKTYELTVIFRPSEDEFTKGKQLVDELLTKQQVSVDASQDLSVRMLAYPIDREEKGHYLYYEFTSPPETVSSLERALKLMNPVLKHLIVKKEEEKPAKKKQKPQRAETPESNE